MYTGGIGCKSHPHNNFETKSYFVQQMCKKMKLLLSSVLPWGLVHNRPKNIWVQVWMRSVGTWRVGVCYCDDISESGGEKDTRWKKRGGWTEYTWIICLSDFWFRATHHLRNWASFSLWKWVKISFHSRKIGCVSHPSCVHVLLSTLRIHLSYVLTKTRTLMMSFFGIKTRYPFPS